MTDLKRCPGCHKDFPGDLIRPLTLIGGDQDESEPLRCPICALAQINAIHGFPPSTPFSAPQARSLYGRAVKYARRHHHG